MGTASARHIRRLAFAGVVATVIGYLVLSTFLDPSSSLVLLPSFSSNKRVQDKQTALISAFLKKQLAHILQAEPRGVNKLETYSSHLNDINGNAILPDQFDTQSLGNYLQVSEHDRAELTRAHRQLVDSLPVQVPEGLFNGTGIVMTAGGKYFPIALVAIRWIRETNDIPIELFMADESEYEPKYCEELLPELNVKCKVINEIYGKDTLKNVDYKGYPLKALSILASSFENIYMMDSDSYPINNVTAVFENEPYTSTGYIMFPDFWEQMTSPTYYDIAGVTLGDRARGDISEPYLKQQDRANAIPGRTVESGQIYVNKTEHYRSLALATYYNLFGRKYFYPLIMQGGPGEGDKDTFPAAAVALDEQFYKCDSLGVAGIHGDGFIMFGMIQYDPMDTFKKGPGQDKYRVATAHCNMAKFNPRLMFDDFDPQDEHIFLPRRILGTLAETLDMFQTGNDVELQLFDAVRCVTCEWANDMGYIPSDWKGRNISKWCEKLERHIEWLEANPQVE